MDLRQLAYFAKVAEHRHFGRAAEELHITQPPLSQTISALERELHVTLLDRTTRRVELTEAGQALQTHAKDILGLAEAARSEVVEMAEGSRGTIRIGVIGSAMYLQLPAVVHALRGALPEAGIQVVPEYFTSPQMRMLSDHLLDIGLVRNSAPDDTIDTAFLGYESLAVAVRDDDTLGHTATRQELGGRSVLCYPADQSVIGRLVQNSLKDGSTDPPTFIEVPHTSSMLAMVAAGVGVAVIPESATVLQLPGVRYARAGGLPRIGLEAAFRRREMRPLVRAAVEVIESVEIPRLSDHP
ncbi:LysR family transcriptional regulator [Nocardiopsis salina]|uniref:LysR family transcriptional regulator n=1 Tax=Nocardiopsis salina TaxID=245836 RepID=UPI00034C1957|nr:LysR family transcriptional regulator [Nocardiopsis salina]